MDPTPATAGPGAPGGLGRAKASAVVGPSEQRGVTSEIFVTDTPVTIRSLWQEIQTENVKFTVPVPAAPAPSPRTSALDWGLWLAWLQGTQKSAVPEML